MFLRASGLGQRRDRVLQVEEDLVGREALGLVQHLQAGAGYGQAGPAGTRYAHGRLLDGWTMASVG